MIFQNSLPHHLFQCQDTPEGKFIFLAEELKPAEEENELIETVV